ncbi:hypothetical protein CI109_104693 [Kwoniella shandongensis]|uniref:Uncharacterized protein n=1 Tax=Kwoniella shandongensis TaxID=1734106 RepID=A0A5M6BVH0_9TREE|nr:uncharacterized protein CI109_004856 [Kwoniella shandongensis]KAA5526856.1 hypothetical protein CI109_004856 [Kwoniella shandongensis]
MVGVIGSQDQVKELETCRKALSKAKPYDIQDGILLSQAADLIMLTYPESSELKQLEVSLTVLRQLATLLSLPEALSTDLLALTRDRIIPSFQPGEYLATLTMSNLEHPLKNQQTRAAEILTAASKLSTLIPSASTSTLGSSASSFMVPLFRQAIGGGVSRRSNMAAILAMLEYIPTSAVPSTLLGDLLEDLGVVDLANMRCTLIINLLVPRNGKFDPSILESLIPYFDPDDHPHTVMVNMKRYLLPALFAKSPKYVQALLDLLSARPTLFAAWVTVASLGVSLGLLKVEDLPQEDLEDALAHEEADVRLRAFELVAGAKSFYTPKVMELIKQGLQSNATLPNAGARSSLSSTTYAFFVRLHQLETATHRNARKQVRTPAIEAEAAQLAHVLSASSSFRNWFLAEFIDHGINQAKRYPVFNVLLALNLLARYLEVFGERMDTQEMVFTRERVEGLIACQASEFTEVRSRSRKILESATIALPGYEDISTPASHVLLSSALRSLNQPRKTQAEAGKAALCILFSGLATNDASQTRALAFIADIVSRLEESIEIAERDLVKGIEEHPLHGLLSAIRDLLLCLSLSTEEAQSAWRSTLIHLVNLINRIWGLTRPVISLASTKSEDSTESRPEHEIARAFEVMGGGGEDGEDDDESMDHTGLLSGCWRATKDAGELLETIVTLPISHGGEQQTVWSRDAVDEAGKSFLTWLHEIRHRGTFSKIALAFAHLVEIIRPIKSLGDLCDGWLRHELTTISSDQLSTTRRSAALPYSILSIVSNDIHLLDTAVTALVNLARVDNLSTSNVTKVHAFNVLKIVLLDARQTKYFDRYFEKGVMMALGAFESEDWNVRNVGLILFSTLVHRCLSPPRGGQDYYRSRSTLATRKSFSNFHAKYPLILPFITASLRKSTESTDNVQASLNKHSPLFPILIIIRSLRWSEGMGELQTELERAVRPYLRSREYHVRQVAAQALSSLLSPSDAIQRALNIHHHISSTEINQTHGFLLLLHQLIANVIIWDDVDVKSKETVQSHLTSMIDHHVPGTCPPITQAVMQCVSDYIENAKPTSDYLVRETLDKARTQLRDRERTSVPGDDLRHTSYVEFILKYSSETSAPLSLLSTASTDETHQLALERLPHLPTMHTPETLERVLALASCTKKRTSNASKVLALDALAEIEWPKEALSQMQRQGKWEEVCEGLLKTLNTKCVPVREAALPALGWTINQSLLLSPGEQKLGEHLDLVAAHILKFSHQDESQPTRFSAFKALEHLTVHLFTSSASPTLHQALLRLVQDDDEEIRQGAASIIASGLGRKRGVVQSKAVGLWWSWVEDHLLSLSGARREAWLSWLKVLAADRTGVEEDLKTLSGDTGPEVIFEIESSNIFRDPLVDAAYANKLLKRLGVSLSTSAHTTSAGDTDEGDIVGRVKEAMRDVAIQSDLSPIDDAWEARKVLTRRLELRKPTSK